MKDKVIHYRDRTFEVSFDEADQAELQVGWIYIVTCKDFEKRTVKLSPVHDVTTKYEPEVTIG